MAFWNFREELSQVDRIRRSYYELLRDELDQFLLQYALIDSYHNFVSQKIAFPFVEKRELKPRAAQTDAEGHLPRDVIKKMAALGLLSLPISEADGGPGLRKLMPN